MTLFVDVGGLKGVGLNVYGGEEEYYAAREGKEPPTCNFRPKTSNIAPRAGGWEKSRNNTQTAPRSGPDANLQPEATQERSPLFPKPVTRMGAP